MLRREWERYQQRIDIRGEVIALEVGGPEAKMLHGQLDRYAYGPDRRSRTQPGARRRRAARARPHAGVPRPRRPPLGAICVGFFVARLPEELRAPLVAAAPGTTAGSASYPLRAVEHPGARARH
jgi:hypothetical protein